MFGKIKVAPSILSADFSALGSDVRMVGDAGADYIHVDVMDGHFVPNLTMGPAHVKALKGITEVPLDVHLMVDNPSVQAPWFLDAGADIVSFHIEACADHAEALALIDAIHEREVLAGVAISPDTDVERLSCLLDRLDMVLVMSVHPGFGGQSFIECTPERISQVVEMCRAQGVSPAIEVDGGINCETARLVRAAGADVLVAGSAIYGADDPTAALKALRGEEN